MMNFASQELNDWGETNNYFEFTPSYSETKTKVNSDSVKLIADKLRLPTLAVQVKRP